MLSPSARKLTPLESTGGCALLMTSCAQRMSCLLLLLLNALPGSTTSDFNDMAIDTSSDRALAEMLNEQQKIELQIQQQRREDRRSQHHASSSKASVRGSPRTSRPSVLKQQSVNSISVHEKRTKERREASSVLSSIVASCIQNNTVFLDPEFPTTINSLYGSRFRELQSKESQRENLGVLGRRVQLKTFRTVSGSSFEEPHPPLRIYNKVPWETATF